MKRPFQRRLWRAAQSSLIAHSIGRLIKAGVALPVMLALIWSPGLQPKLQVEAAVDGGKPAVAPPQDSPTALTSEEARSAIQALVKKFPGASPSPDVPIPMTAARSLICRALLVCHSAMTQSVSRSRHEPQTVKSGPSLSRGLMEWATWNRRSSPPRPLVGTPRARADASCPLSSHRDAARLI